MTFVCILMDKMPALARASSLPDNEDISNMPTPSMGTAPLAACAWNCLLLVIDLTSRMVMSKCLLVRAMRRRLPWHSACRRTA